jgi:hypothetical protein
LGILSEQFEAIRARNPDTFFLSACRWRDENASSTFPPHLPVSEANKTGEKQLPGACPRLRIEPVCTLIP